MAVWGLIGASNIARQYMINAIRSQPDTEIGTVMSTDLDRADTFARENSIPKTTTSLDELLADARIDCVYISTTNDLHYAQGMAAIAAGKHVLCEKPLALSLANATEMVAAADQAGVVFATNHHLRNASLHRRIHDLVASGELGEILFVRIFHAVFLPAFLQGWRVQGDKVGGGVILDITVHDADTVRFTLDDDPLEITALSVQHGMGANGLADGVMGVMRMSKGALVQFHDAYTVEHTSTGYEVIGTRGALIGRNCMTQNPVGDLLLRRDSTETVIDDFDRSDLYTRSVANFTAAVNGIGVPSATGQDGLWSLATALAAQESADTGNVAPIRVN